MDQVEKAEDKYKKSMQVVRDLQGRVDELEQELQEDTDRLLGLGGQRRRRGGGAGDRQDMQDVKALIKEYLSSHAILDATLAGIFIGQTIDTKVPVSSSQAYFDLKDLLDMSQYSGAGSDLKVILQEADKKKAMHERPSQVDSKLLDDETARAFGSQINKFLQEKSKQVQYNTSKKIIPHFVKHIETAERGAQTGFNDDKLIKELQHKMATVAEEMDELRIKFASVQSQNQILGNNLKK